MRWKMKRIRPSFWNILVTSNSIISIGLAILFLIVVMILGSSFTFDLGFISTTAFFIVFIFLLSSMKKQYQLLNNIFINSVEVVGEIVGLHFTLGLGYVTYKYSYDGHSFRSTDRVRHNGKAKELKLGQKIMLYVNHDRPSQAYIRDLYV